MIVSRSVLCDVGLFMLIMKEMMVLTSMSVIELRVEDHIQQSTRLIGIGLMNSEKIVG